MSTTGTNLINQIDADITNYAPKAFHNKRLNAILKQLVAWVDSGGTTGPAIQPNLTVVTSADFSTTVDCPIPALNGSNLAVLWVDVPKPLILGTDFSLLAGGGFTMLTAGFNKADATYTFWVFTTT